MGDAFPQLLGRICVCPASSGPGGLVVGEQGRGGGCRAVAEGLVRGSASRFPPSMEWELCGADPPATLRDSPAVGEPLCPL